jgi:hypothetical protein
MTHSPLHHPPAHHEEDLRNLGVEFEKKDVCVPALLKIGLALLAMVLLSAFIARRTFITLVTHQPVYQEQLSPLRIGNPEPLPPEPRLQGAPGHPMFGPEELRRLRADAQARLSSYGWVDQSAGIAHIPIDRAIDIIAENGLPEVSAPSAPLKASTTPAAGSPARATGVQP